MYWLSDIMQRCNMLNQWRNIYSDVMQWQTDLLWEGSRWGRVALPPPSRWPWSPGTRCPLWGRTAFLWRPLVPSSTGCPPSSNACSAREWFEHKSQNQLQGECVKEREREREGEREKERERERERGRERMSDNYYWKGCRCTVRLTVVRKLVKSDLDGMP